MTKDTSLMGSNPPSGDILTCFEPLQGREVVRIAADGRIFWMGREVFSDDQFRAAMMDIRTALMNQQRWPDHRDHDPTAHRHPNEIAQRDGFPSDEP